MRLFSATSHEHNMYHSTNLSILNQLHPHIILWELYALFRHHCKTVLGLRKYNYMSTNNTEQIQKEQIFMQNCKIVDIICVTVVALISLYLLFMIVKPLKTITTNVRFSVCGHTWPNLILILISRSSYLGISDFALWLWGQETPKTYMVDCSFRNMSWMFCFSWKNNHKTHNHT